MAQTKAQRDANQVAIRRGNFERHVAECRDCTIGERDGSPLPAVFCMSGTIMLHHYIAAVRG